MSNYHISHLIYSYFFAVCLILGPIVSTANVQANETVSWEERQRAELKELSKAFGVEPAEETSDLIQEDKKFLSETFAEGSDYTEDSISSKLAAPMRKKSADASDQELEALVPKSNPFERKRRGR
jgi:hypothetical protein